MTTPLPLVTEVSQVIPGMPPRGRAPNIAVVYATASGRLGSYDGWRPMTYREQLRTRYRRRYDVDLSHHRRRAYMLTTPLPARGDYYFFHADVEVGFRVHDPVEIVRRNITDATRVVYTHLADEFRRITRKYDIEDSELAESEIVTRFDADDVLDDGITVFYVAPRLLPDEKAARYLQEKRDAERKVLTGLAEHKLALQQARQRGELKRMDRELERQEAERELAGMAGRQLDAGEIVRRHLARHPDDTKGALDLLVQHRKAWMEHQEQYNRRTAELFESIVDHRLVQAADMEKLLPQMLAQIGIVPPPVPVEATVGAEWTEPSVLETEQVTEAVVVEPPEARSWTPEDGVQPVYLVLDESAGAGTVLPLLNAELPGMLAAIAAEPAAPAIRLAVLGFGPHLAVRRPLTPADPPGDAPHLAGAGDQAAYAVLFAELGERIETDLESLAAAPLVHPPVVYLLCASAPEDNWAGARRRLADPDRHQLPPAVTVFAVADAASAPLAGMAGAGGHTYHANPGIDDETAVAHFAEYVVRDVTGRARRLVDDRPLPEPPGPEGFSSTEEEP